MLNLFLKPLFPDLFKFQPIALTTNGAKGNDPFIFLGKVFSERIFFLTATTTLRVFKLEIVITAHDGARNRQLILALKSQSRLFR